MADPKMAQSPLGMDRRPCRETIDSFRLVSSHVRVISS
jgi:hypothetical protein